MSGLKLAKLPDRAPIKLSISIMPEIHKLEAYAQAYATAYGSVEPVAELIPAMLAAFLESDRVFVRSQGAPR